MKFMLHPSTWLSCLYLLTNPPNIWWRQTGGRQAKGSDQTLLGARAILPLPCCDKKFPAGPIAQLDGRGG